MLAGIWSNTLKLDRIGVHDDFFALGGHSLLALQLIHEINVAVGVELPVRQFFTEPTVAGQARAIERMRTAAGPAEPLNFPLLVPLRVGGSNPPFFLVAGGFGAEAELLVYAGLVRHLNNRQPFYGLRIRGVDDLVEPAESVEQIAAEHLAEIRKVQPHGPYFIGGSCVGGVVALEIAQQIRAQNEEVGSLILVDSRFPSWNWLLRNRFREFWNGDVVPLWRSLRQSQANFQTALKDRIAIRFNPSSEQKVGREKTRIGWKYLRTIMRYSPRPYAGQIILLVCEEEKTRARIRIWRDVADEGLKIHFIPGDHITHLRQYAAATAARLDECLQNGAA